MMRPHFIPAYSVCHPSTSSASASDRSNGTRSDSAIAATRNAKNPMICGTMYHMVSNCACTIPPMVYVSAARQTVASMMSIGTSYEIMSSAALIPPIREYLLFCAQPAQRIRKGASANRPKMISRPAS